MDEHDDAGQRLDDRLRADLKDLVRMRPRQLAGRGQLEPTAAAVEQIGSEAAFQFADLPADVCGVTWHRSAARAMLPDRATVQK